MTVVTTGGGRGQTEPSSGEHELGTSVGKALALLSAFEASDPVGVSALARRANLPKSTAFRLLAVLERWGLVERRGSLYCLGTRLFELGNLIEACRPERLREVARPYLVELYGRSHLVAHLAVLHDGDVVYLDKVHGHEDHKCPSRVGGRMPSHCCGVGKVLLAFSSREVVSQVLERGLERRTAYTLADPRLLLDQLREVRRVGYAVDREEARLGLSCIAAPILDAPSRTVAAVSLSGPAPRLDIDQHLGPVRRAAAAITRQLRTTAHSPPS